MRCLATILLLALIVTATSWAQSTNTPRHPDNPNAEFVGQFTVDISTVPSSRGSLSIFADGTWITMTVVVFNIGGRTDYYLDPSGMTFNGNCDWVNGKSTGEIFELASKMAISQGLELGYATCQSECGLVNNTTRVYAPACVKRTGEGSATHFEACSLSAYSMREYVVCCPNGIEAPLTDLIFKLNGGLCLLENGCEATCP